eukprot:TRINITY_DN9128_c0_g1_i1.p1 TRINITY_DN9128_c0_g1~~TRINITY_DN9128_c0_g1_i1.p1  ORF type:complete len:271 (-),score=55.25 TRINITY_DN9128_c0_g1_i1:31-843(-)
MKVTVVILAAGYGTRLGRDIEKDTSGLYKDLVGKAKPLVPVKGKALITHWLEHFKDCKEWIETVYLVCNDLHYPQFVSWAKENDLSEENIINDGTKSNEGRLGAIKDLELVLRTKNITDSNILVVGGDTLFLMDFNLKSIIQHFQQLLTQNSHANLHLCYTISGPAERLQRGIIELNDNNQITMFLEKPKIEETNSLLGSVPFYLYSKHTLPLIHQYVEQSSTLAEVDSPGRFVSWLYSREPVFCQVIKGRYDIGSLEEYIQTNTLYGDK